MMNASVPPSPPALPNEATSAPSPWWRASEVLFPDRYAWYVLAAVMDVVVTVTVLVHYGAREVNSLAQASMDRFDTWGLIALKFLTLVVVVLICEYVGRKNVRLGRILATLAIAASLMPVLAATAQVLWLWGTDGLMYTEWPRPTP